MTQAQGLKILKTQPWMWGSPGTGNRPDGVRRQLHRRRAARRARPTIAYRLSRLAPFPPKPGLGPFGGHTRGRAQPKDAVRHTNVKPSLSLATAGILPKCKFRRSENVAPTWGSASLSNRPTSGAATSAPAPSLLYEPMDTNKTDSIVHNKVLIWVVLATGFVLLVPLLAMRFTDEVAWTLLDFVTAGTLVFGAGSRVCAGGEDNAQVSSYHRHCARGSAHLCLGRACRRNLHDLGKLM